MALLVLIAGWLVPGAGHLLLGKWVRGLLLFVTLMLMFGIGLALKGKIYSPNTGELLDILMRPQPVHEEPDEDWSSPGFDGP